MTAINKVMEQSKEAFLHYSMKSNDQIANFLEQIALEIESLGSILISTAMEESNLPEARLVGERGRTCGQLRLFASTARQGTYLQASIDTAQPNRAPIPKPDIRKINQPLGPIVVFGASNFPLAFSTAGGDTASALAAGCSVVLKAHPAHPKTSKLVSGAIANAIERCTIHPQVFQHIDDTDFETGKALVQHPYTAGVAFTGSHNGGTALLQYAQERKQPIPVFAEMGSINPVVFLGDVLSKEADKYATMLANAITMGVGQFCTNPGLIFGLKSTDFDDFAKQLATKIDLIPGAKMLHNGIKSNYIDKLKLVLEAKGVDLLTSDRAMTQDNITAMPYLAKASGNAFLNNPNLNNEVFGPFSLLVEFDDIAQLFNAISSMEGQLTATLIAHDDDIIKHKPIVNALALKVGRLLCNGVPTGVEVCHSMIHGGPYPATTDARFTSVGAEAIVRWYRPVCYQNFPDDALPEALQNENKYKLVRLINGIYSSASL